MKPPLARFALDEGFPRPPELLSLLRKGIPSVEVGVLEEIDERLSGLEDWLLLRALHVRGWRALITTDGAMLWLPREMTVLHQLKMSLIVAEGVQNDAVAAAGMLMVHLRKIAEQHVDSRAQIWRLRAKTQESTGAWDCIMNIASRQGLDPKDVERRHRLSAAELNQDPLG